MKYFLDRLAEPGTMRSLIWTLMALAGHTVTDAALAHYALSAVVVLGLISAALPEKRAQPQPMPTEELVRRVIEEAGKK